MIELLSKERRLTPEIVAGCFDPGKHNFIDKQMCGNGFSTSFLKMKPSPGKQNIMIAPNKAVVIDKENQYKADPEHFNNNRITFVYQEATNRDWKDAEIIVFVADSFLNDFGRKNWNNIWTNDIEKLLIDESHSVEIQSLFRYNLRLLNYTIDKYFKATSVASVTATPNKYSKVTHKIINTHLKPVSIHHCNNIENTIARAKESIRNDRKVVLCSNSAALLSEFTTDNKLNAKFQIGESLMRSMVGRAEILAEPMEGLFDELIILSSRGFEGYDINGEGYDVYFFEDRSREHETFFISNLYQAINRTRDGAEYVEYAVAYRATKRPLISKTRVLKFLKSDKLSNEKKLGKTYKEFNDYYIANYLEDGEIELFFNSVKYNLEREKVEFDDGFADFEGFLKDRQITIIPLEGANRRLNKRKPINNTIIKNLLTNEILIKDRDLFGDDFFLKVEKLEPSKRTLLKDKYIETIETFLMYKNFDGTYEMTGRQRRALEILSVDPAHYVKKLTKSYNEYYIKKLGYKKSADKRERFKNTAETYFFMLVQMFVNDKITVPKNIVAHRDYNMISLINLEVTKIMADEFVVELHEVDIKSCFSRILYALCNLGLPGDYYGEDKKNKLKINQYLNMCWYDCESSTPKKLQKLKAKQRLESVKIDPVVIDFILENFFETIYPGDLFNLLAWHEKRIIGLIKSLISADNDFLEGKITRHDSLILFGKITNISELNSFVYLGQTGWFDISSEFEDEFFTFLDDLDGNEIPF